MIRLIIAEDHDIVRSGICGLLDAENDMKVVGAVANGVGAMKLLADGTVADLVVTDFRMPKMDGLELLKNIGESYPGLGVLLLSVFADHHYITSAFDNGARGYVLKTSSFEELTFCIRQAVLGRRVMCNGISLSLLENASISALRSSTDIVLSEREVHILELLSQGYNNKEIADMIFASRRTVEGYRQSMVIKAGVRITFQLVRFACKNGLI